MISCSASGLSRCYNFLKTSKNVGYQKIIATKGVRDMLIGREQEIAALNDLYQSGQAELVALYGRRRVGKTFLIDETFAGRISFRHAGLSPVDEAHTDESRRKSRMKEQLRHFHRSLAEQGLRDAEVPESWLDAFYLLEDLLKQEADGIKRLLVFIDEIQWLDTPRAGFMTGLEAFWNGWACHRHDIMLIVCGSSSSWVLDKLVNNHGGLYDRVTYQMCLAPFSLRECELYLESNGVALSRYDIVQTYMMLGGIPYYLRYLKRGMSFAQAADALFFERGARLRGEFDRLFSSLFSNPEVMKLIVTSLSEKSRGLTRQELIQSSGIADSGELSKQLRALEAGSFIMSYASFGSGKRQKRYKLADPFCIFWLRFVRGSEGKSTSWVNMSDSGSVNAWRGLAFENACWNHIAQLKKALGISGVSTSESLWSKRGGEEGRGAQIDLIIERRDNVVNMCEMKFTSDVFAVDKDYHLTLVRRREMLRELIPKKAAIHSTLVTTYGLKYNAYSGDFVSTITVDDLFAP